ncbi:hypothetical protein AB8880_05735 [Alphaproteobacteria bacterium LSUCC0684]
MVQAAGEEAARTRKRSSPGCWKRSIHAITKDAPCPRAPAKEEKRAAGKEAARANAKEALRAAGKEAARANATSQPEHLQKKHPAQLAADGPKHYIQYITNLRIVTRHG